MERELAARGVTISDAVQRYEDHPYWVGAFLDSEGNKLWFCSAAGLLTRSERDNPVLYQANRACPVFAELAALLRKTGRPADVLRAALLELADRIRFARVFGSVARGTKTSLSVTGH